MSQIIIIVIGWILAVPLMFFAYPTLMLLALGLAPTLVFYAVERTEGKPGAISIGSFNLAGTLPYMVELWENRQSMSFLWRTLEDPNAWLFMYGSAFVGYSIYWGVPKVVLAAMRITARNRVRRLRQVQQDLIKEWGTEIKPDQRFKAHKEAQKTTKEQS